MCEFLLLFTDRCTFNFALLGGHCNHIVCSTSQGTGAFPLTGCAPVRERNPPWKRRSVRPTSSSSQHETQADSRSTRVLNQAQPDHEWTLQGTCATVRTYTTALQPAIKGQAQEGLSPLPSRPDFCSTFPYVPPLYLLSSRPCTHFSSSPSTLPQPVIQKLPSPRFWLHLVIQVLWPRQCRAHSTASAGPASPTAPPTATYSLTWSSRSCGPASAEPTAPLVQALQALQHCLTPLSASPGHPGPAVPPRRCRGT